MEEPATETKTVIETKALTNSLTILGKIHDLIGNALELLESAEDLLEDCCYDHQALLALLPTDAQKTLAYLIDPIFLNWYSAHKDVSPLNKIILFTDTIKDSKILYALHFALTLKHEFPSIFKGDNTSFSALQNFHELIKTFENVLQTKNAFFSQEIDTLILWLAKNKTSIQNSTDIILLDPDEDDECLHQKSSDFMDNMLPFLKQLKTCVLECMLIHIDDEGRHLGLCPPYDDLVDANRGQLLYQSYIQNPILKQKMDYLHFFPFLDLGLQVLDQQFRQQIMRTQNIDHGLIPVKRVAYLFQALDPKALFTIGFCMGDSVNWCQKMLFSKDKTFNSAPPTFNSRKSLHSEPISDDIYALQMKHQWNALNNDYHALSQVVDNPESAKDFCMSILEWLRSNTPENNSTVCFTVILGNQYNTIAHQISFCRFFRSEIECFRIRDLNLGEFEAAFSELQAWYPSIYAATYGIPSAGMPRPYNNARIMITTLQKNPKKILQPNDPYRMLIEENLNFYLKYTLFAENTLETNLKIFHAIKMPTLRDVILHICSALMDVLAQLYSHPKAVITKLDCILQQILALQNPNCHFIQSILEITLMIALFNDNQMNVFKTKLSNWLSSLSPQAQAKENFVILKIIFEQLKNSAIVNAINKTTQEQQGENILNIMLYCQERLSDISNSIEEQITKLNNLKKYDTRTCLKILSELSETYCNKMSYCMVNEKFFRKLYELEYCELPEDAMHPCIAQAMERFISNNAYQNGATNVSESCFSLAPIRLFMPENPISRPLMFMQRLHSPHPNENKQEESKQYMKITCIKRPESKT
jgi:hypothetical protein